MEEYISKLNDIKTIWLSSEAVPNDLTDWGIPHLTKERIGYTIDECQQLFIKLKDIDWQGPVAIAVHEASTNIGELSNYVSTRLQQPNPQQDFNTFVMNLNKVLVLLRNAAVFSTDKVYNAERELLRVTSQIESSKAILQNLAKFQEDVAQIKSQVETSFSKVSANEKSVSEIQDKVNVVSANISPIEPQIKEIHTKAEQYVFQIAKNKEDISQLRGQYDELYDKISKEAATLGDLQGRCLKQQEEIQKTIEDASRLGMAGSFRMRKKELTRPLILWAVSFFLGVTALTLLAYFKILPLLEQHQFDWFAFFARLPLIAPALWFSWFCVKQFGYTTRLWEDYSFKYASAMAFEGYKREALNISPEMSKLLIEISIINFSSNPLRIYDSKNVHSSPLNELTDSSKGILEQLVSLVKSATSKEQN